MKKIIVLFTALLFLATAGFAQKKHHHSSKAKKIVKVEIAPAAVQSAFAQNFSNTADVKWKKTAAGNWDAAFKQDSLQTDAEFTETGNLITTHTEYTAENLPENILSAVKAKYPDAAVREGVKIRRTDVASYYKVSIDQGGANKDLLVNETGTTITE